MLFRSATPLGPRDIAAAEVAWALSRGLLYALGFVVLIVLLGLARSPLIVLAVPGALLIGFATAGVGTAATTFMKRWQDFDLVTVVMQPLFLFSGTFFTLELYPAPLQVLVQLTPLYHAVALLRALVGLDGISLPLFLLTLLVVPQSGVPTLIIPRLEAPRVVQMPAVFGIAPWNETDDPVALAHSLLGDARTVAVGDQMWSRFLVDLLVHRPKSQYVRSVVVMSALRTRKDAAEIDALAAAGAAADRVAAQLHAGEIPLVGRTESQVSADISARLIAEGHDKVNFAIVAAGENAASPHHHPGDRVIRHGEIEIGRAHV